MDKGDLKREVSFAFAFAIAAIVTNIVLGIIYPISAFFVYPNQLQTFFSSPFLFFIIEFWFLLSVLFMLFAFFERKRLFKALIYGAFILFIFNFILYFMGLVNPFVLATRIPSDACFSLLFSGTGWNQGNPVSVPLSVGCSAATIYVLFYAIVFILAKYLGNEISKR